MSETTDREQAADDSDIEIVPLSEITAKEHSIRSELPARVYSSLAPRQRRRRLFVFVMLAALILLIVFSSMASIREFAARIIPTPAPAPPLDASQFYVQSDPPWGQLVIDGRAITHVPVIGTDPPLRLSFGRHMLQWRAAPFLTQSCTLTVPANYISDTCKDDANSAPISGGRYVRIVTFAASLNNLSPEQRAALTGATQAALDSQQSTATVRTGEYYALPPDSCRFTQPAPPQLAPCYTVAKQPLRATLGFQLDTDASADLSCDSPEPDQPCTFSQQNCHLFCTTDFAPSVWMVGTAVRALWTFTTFNGKVVARDVPDNALEEDFVLVQIAWDRAGWHVMPLLGGSNGSLPPFGYPTCQSIESNTNMFGSMSGALEWNFAASSVLAEGCAAEATLEPLLGATPTPSARGAYCLYRFGIILAVNKLAHRYWPYFPVADAYEQSLAQRDIS